MEKNGPKTLSPQGLSMSAYLVGMTLRPWSSVLFSTLLGCLLGCTSGPELDLIDANAVLTPTLSETPADYEGMGFPDSWLNDPAMGLYSVLGEDVDITDEGATLGRVLFHDVQLSADGSTSCGTCHRQSSAFADSRARSRGISGESLHRNAPGLFNLRYQQRMFWDQRVIGLSNQVLQPIGHPDEMGMSLDLLPEKLRSLAYYPNLFEAAFGDPSIDLDRIADALVQFLLSIRSHQSRYDAGLANGFEDFTASESLGRNVFFRGDTRCNQCHSSLNFFAPSGATINGLDVDYAAAGDGGIGDLTGQASDDGRFKTVSLRNVGLTAPYMHDGRFTTLREVVDFYSDGIQPHPFLDERLSENGIGPAGQEPYRLQLTETERQGLVDFLNTLSDTVIVSMQALSDPFEAL